jgi:hypothetical protein
MSRDVKESLEGLSPNEPSRASHYAISSRAISSRAISNRPISTGAIPISSSLALVKAGLGRSLRITGSPTEALEESEGWWA